MKNKLAPFIKEGKFGELEPIDPERFDDLELKKEKKLWTKWLCLFSLC